jgi:hypothetical protein
MMPEPLSLVERARSYAAGVEAQGTSTTTRVNRVQCAGLICELAAELERIGQGRDPLSCAEPEERVRLEHEAARRRLPLDAFILACALELLELRVVVDAAVRGLALGILELSDAD